MKKNLGKFLRNVANKIVRIGLSSDKIFQQLCGRRAYIFLFHDVTEKPSQFTSAYSLGVSLECFEAQILWIKKHFKIIDPNQLITNESGERPQALITFDDGLPGYFLNAVPILQKHKCPSIIFLNMEPVQGGVFWSGLATYVADHDPRFHKWRTTVSLAEPDINFLNITPQIVNDYLTWRGDSVEYLREVHKFHGGFATSEMLENAARLPGVYFGSHLFNHRNATTLTPQELTESYLKNERALQGYSNYCNLFSYPFGQPGSCFNRETNRIILSLGAARLFDSIQLSNNRRDAKLLHRINMTDDVVSEALFKKRVLAPSLQNGFNAHKYTPSMALN